MAFAVNRKELDELRAALRHVIEEAETERMRAVFDRYTPRFKRDLGRLRFRVRRATLEDFCAIAQRAAALLDLEVDLSELEHWLQGREALDLKPNHWLNLGGSVAGAPTKELLNLNESKGVRLVLKNRVHVLLSLLRELRDPDTKDEEPLSSPRPEAWDVSWVKDLRFGSHQDAPSRTTIVDPIEDVLLAPSGLTLGSGDTAPYDLLNRVRDAIRPLDILQALIGPFVMSEGPGPFLPMPEMAVPLEDPSWDKLPLFSVSHWNWPLVDCRVLEG